MHQKTIDALVNYNQAASSLLATIAAFGDAIKWSCKEPLDPDAEVVEMRMSMDDMRGLVAMFGDVNDFVQSTASADYEKFNAAVSEQS